MNIVEFAIIFIILIVLPFVGLYKLFEKAGQPGWQAVIPLYNIYVMIKLSGRPAWWIILMFIPGINFLIAIGITVDFVKSYGKFKLTEQFAGVLLEFIYFPKWGFDKETKYIGPSASDEFKEKYQNSLKKSTTREWTEAIIFAVVAATLIRTLFIEAYVIPSGSMESTLLVGDYLFVSKINYGPRTPITPISFPFAQNTMPLIGTKSYSDLIKLPYYRLPGLSDIKKGDVVVFNYPMQADTPFLRPVDKRDNYIKRCQATPGDTLSISNAQVFINNKAMPNPPQAQPSYLVHTDGNEINPQVLTDLHIFIIKQFTASDYEMIMTRQSSAKLKSYSNIKSVKEYYQVKDLFDPECFPHDPHIKWNADNYGPIIIPKRGWTVKLDSLTFPVYRRAIQVYENNQVQIVGSAILINGKKASSYTFKLNYYWMMGDNRHNSEDSRFWGFVPEDHIVGKALFIWMSTDSASSFPASIRWSRLFRGIH
ncbi:MAG: lepB [Mucilaginibacter sp.]|nr:lepB [Mucilaginibacter sp.]